MTARHSLAISIAAGAAANALGTPALAQDTPYAPGTYEYANPAPPAVEPRSEPMVQPIPIPLPAPYPAPRSYEHENAYNHDAPPPPVEPVAPHSVPYAGAHYTHAAPVPHQAPAGAYPYPPPYSHGSYAQPADFQRDAWLDDCRERVRGIDRRDRGGVIGGLLGGIAGGVVGNRAWGAERLAGTLIGAGVGGLAGIAIGSAIGAASERRRQDDCENYLDRYMAGGPREAPQYGHGHPGYGYGWTTTMVPVVVPIPQRAVVREYVAEEWVDEPVAHATAPVKYVPISRPAPTKYVPARRTKYVKGR